LVDSIGTPELILMASGSEVTVTLSAAEKLQGEGINVRVISFPSWELFEQQTDEYKNYVLPPSVSARVSVEAAVKLGWERYTGTHGESISIEKFGSSAPEKILMEKYGFTPQNVYETGKRVLEKIKK